MSTRASVHNHPIHPMLIVFPIGLWVFSVVCYAIFLATGGARVADRIAVFDGWRSRRRHPGRDPGNRSIS